MVNKDLQNMKIDSGMVIVLEDFQFAWNKKENRCSNQVYVCMQLSLSSHVHILVVNFMIKLTSTIKKVTVNLSKHT